MKTVIITLLLSLSLLAPASAQNPVTVQQFGGSVDTNSGNKSANTQRVVIATDQPTNSNAWLVSGTVAATQSGTWTVQPGNTANTTAWKVDGSAVTQPVSGTFWQVTQPVSGTVTANQGGAPWSENITQVGGAAVTLGQKTAANSIPEVPASDYVGGADVVGNVTFSAGTACPAASATVVTTSAGCIVVPTYGNNGVTVEIQAGTLAATVTYESSYDGGTTWVNSLVLAGATQSATGSVFTNPNAQTAVNWLIGSGTSHVRARVSAFTSGTAIVYGRASKLQSAVAIGSLTAGLFGVPTTFWGNLGAFKATTATPTAATAGNNVASAADVYGVPYSRSDHPNRIRCTITTANATSTTVTNCTAPAAGLSIYITDISVYGGVANGVTAAATIQSGTGGNCAATVTILYYCQHAATAGCEAHFLTPIRAGTISEVCILDAAVGTKFVTISGITAP